MYEEKPEIVIGSRYKNVQYHMYSNIILVKETDNIFCIELPHKDKVVGFYDMYYVDGFIHVIVATQRCYDIRYILDEENYKLVSEQLSK